jgi:hypothetical protein
MPALTPVRKVCLASAITLVALLVGCRLDMLLKPTNPPHPVLSITPAEVRDTGRARSDDVQHADIAITNGGGGEFTWEASDHADWIRLDPNEGDVPGTLTISMDPEDLGPGVYESDVTVVARGSADSQVTSIPVTFVVQRPGLNVLPLLIERSTNATSNAVFTETLQISNSGTGDLFWTITKQQPWLTVGTTSGRGDADVQVTINSTGLAGGTYRDEIVVTAPGALGSPARVAVTLTVLAPGLAVSPGLLRESAPSGSTTPISRTLRVTNSGNGTITWSASRTQSWVSLSKLSGGAPEDVIITLDPTGLPPGMQLDTVTFTSPEATNGLIKVPVELEILQPGLMVTPAFINTSAESNDPKRQDFDLSVTNSGGGTLAWFASANTPWLFVSPLVGLAPSTLRVTIDPRGLALGTHNGSVTVSSPGAVGSPFTIPVQLVVVSKACNETSIVPDVVREGMLNAEDCEAPHRPGSFANLYGFSANAGETISIRLTATFDAYLIFTDGAGNVLAQNDECPGETGTACIREIPITTSGRYFIEATSAAPGASGALLITVVRERAPASPGELRQYRSDDATQIGVGGTVPEDAVVIRGRIDDPNETDFVRYEVELRALASAFSGAPTHLGDFVAAQGGATTVSVRAGSLANNTGYHWQARACDRTGRCSAWLSFGNNAETDADFSIAVPPPGGSPPPSRQQ